jgi:tRNA(His) 5'-end guanylyltransferase
MPVNDALGTRMKEFYEQVPKTRLVRRMPVAIRLDGKAFHTFTRGFQKPFDTILMETMQDTMKYLCENIQGCVLGYTQSDEITLILVDYQTLDTSAWFDYEVQKMCSISASMATMAFNKFFERNVERECQIDLLQEYGIETKPVALCEAYCRSMEKGAMFDARVFNIPKEEVTNLIYWRQLDAARNSVQMVGQANFSHKELQNKTCSMIQDMLHEQKGINWNDFPVPCKRGSCCIRKESDDLNRKHWVIDDNIPMFKGEDRNYIEQLITFD